MTMVAQADMPCQAADQGRMSCELVYLDNNATTPLDPAVVERMLPWMTDRFWNASSAHLGGQAAAQAVDVARHAIADLIGSRPGEVVWTSGATEADNLALKGVLELAPAHRRRLVTVATEHKAILDTADWLVARGTPVTVVPVERDGTPDFARLDDALAADDVALVSVMAANNETGVTVNVGYIAELAHAHGALFHTDATQLVGKLPFDASQSGVDLASLSAHKMYGPKGVGALFVSRRIGVAPQIHGGGHERGARSGTLNVPAIVGFGAAADISRELGPAEAQRQVDLRARLLDELRARLSGVTETTTTTSRLPNTLSLRFEGADAEAVMANAPRVAVSSGSACTALRPEPSHVLRAMGLDATSASECLRLSVGRTTTESDIDEAAVALEVAVNRVRRLGVAR